MKTKKELIKIWEENTKQTIKGVRDFENLSTKDKCRIFDLIK